MHFIFIIKRQQCLKAVIIYVIPLSCTIFFWGFAYHWHGNNQLMEWDYWLYLLTETGSVPYALITCGVFALLFRFLFENRKQWIMGVVVMGLSVLSTQVIKTGLKRFCRATSFHRLFSRKNRKHYGCFLSSRSFRACEISG